MTREAGVLPSVAGVARALADIAHALEPAADLSARLRYALGLLKDIVPYTMCALVDTSASEQELIVLPHISAEEHQALGASLTRRLRLLRDYDEPPLAGPTGFDESRQWPSSLAVPLIGL